MLIDAYECHFSHNILIEHDKSVNDCRFNKMNVILREWVWLALIIVYFLSMNRKMYIRSIGTYEK